MSFSLFYAYGEKLELIGYTNSDRGQDFEEKENYYRLGFFFLLQLFFLGHRKNKVLLCYPHVKQSML